MVVDAAEVGFAVGRGVGDHEWGVAQTCADGVGFEERRAERGHAESRAQILHCGNRFRAARDAGRGRRVRQYRAGARERRDVGFAAVVDREDLDGGHVGS
ncbi:Uncharacterised protein [Mycobacteroides abscessus subsp. abscessus]|nr:Uncharacterised protein [Mycobacteroides abscessus subsp. abscessus]